MKKKTDKKKEQEPDPLDYGSENSQISEDEDVDAKRQFEEEFKEILQFTIEKIKENEFRQTAVKKWRADTRKVMLQVKR